MAPTYSPKRFFRNAPNKLLARYFAEHGFVEARDFERLGETEVDPIFAWWTALDDDKREEMEKDFREVEDLASEGGIRSILDEAEWHQEDLQSHFSKMAGFHERALWTLIEKPNVWPAALAFYRADTISQRYWRKRKNLVSATADVRDETIRQFESELSNFFFSKQGRGRNCKIDCYRRGNLDYFFAYPEDYSTAEVNWSKSGLRRQARRPAFELIFVYSQRDGTLDTYLPGGSQALPAVQQLFAQVILGVALGPEQKDERVYNLNPLKDATFQFIYPPEAGIVAVSLAKLRVSVPSTKERITLEVSADSTDAIPQLLEKVRQGFPGTFMMVTQVAIKVTFSRTPELRRDPTRTFYLTWPNSCTLQHDGRDASIRDMLIRSGIEPRSPIEDAAIGS